MPHGIGAFACAAASASAASVFFGSQMLTITSTAMMSEIP